MKRLGFRAAPHRVTTPFPLTVGVARLCPPSRSCRGASPPAHGFPTGQDPGPIQGPLEHPRGLSRGSSRGTREIPDLRSSRLPQGRAHGTSVEDSGHDQSGRSKLGSQQSPRHGPTRRCSGRAAAGSEQPQASSFVCGSSLPPRPHAAELHWLGCSPVGTLALANAARARTLLTFWAPVVSNASWHSSGTSAALMSVPSRGLNGVPDTQLRSACR